MSLTGHSCCSMHTLPPEQGSGLLWLGLWRFGPLPHSHLPSQASKFYRFNRGMDNDFSADLFQFQKVDLGQPTTQPRATWPQRLLRFILGGGVVVLAVVASQFGGVCEGAFSAAPAVFASTIIALKLA